jgi:hypothetical protein
MRHAFRLGWIATMTAAAMASPATARVGVTSETNGDPLGKPPSQLERVLRVGIDIQADELITTRENDAAHLVFLDGTSLTVSPNAQIKIDRFVYDPAAKTGEIAMTATSGVFRLVGGKISKAAPIQIRTPSATIGIRGGIGLFSVDASQTTAQFLFGSSLSVTAAGHTETAVRPGSEIRAVSGGPPGAPALIANGVLAQVLGRLEAPGHRAGGNARAPDEKAVRSGFSDQNSGRGTGTPPADRLLAERLGQAIDSNVLSQARPLAASFSPAAPPIVFPPAPSIAPIATPGCVDTPHHHHHHHHHHGTSYRR